MIERIRGFGWYLLMVMMTFPVFAQEQPDKPVETTKKITDAIAAGTPPDKQMILLGTAASAGGLMTLVGVVWLLVVVLRGLAGRKPKFLKPIVLILLGVILLLLPKLLS